MKSNSRFVMKTGVFDSIVSRLIVEPDFRERFFSGDPEALDGYDLTLSDGERLNTFTRERFHTEVGSLVTHLLLPIVVAERFAIFPAAYPEGMLDGRLPIRLNPGWAFGNGSHPTTQLCLSALARYLHPGDAFLDIGMGTGILSIAAARLGAVEVRAYDLDREAVDLARKNMALNGVENIVQVQWGTLGDVLQERPQDWNVVAVNIIGEVLLDLLESGLTQTLKKDAFLIGSAIKRQELESIMAALHIRELKLIEQSQKNGWYCVVAGNGNLRLHDRRRQEFG